MGFSSKHNKYVTTPDWFGTSTSETVQSQKDSVSRPIYVSGSSSSSSPSSPDTPQQQITLNVTGSGNAVTGGTLVDGVITLNKDLTFLTAGSNPGSGSDTSFWQLKTDDKGNTYLYSSYDVVSSKGIIMYAEDGSIDIPSIYAGLPIDDLTIIRGANGELMINPNIDLGGASTWDELEGKPYWIGDTKPSYNYNEILQTPDLSVFALKTDLLDYIPIDGYTDVTGLKNFKKGIQIDGLSIYKSQDDVIYVDSNLVVRGGITMYALDDVTINSIIESLPPASTTTKGIASFNEKYFSVVDGHVALIEDNIGLNEDELYQYLTSNNYAKKSDIPSLDGYATKDSVESLGSKVNDFLEGSDTDTIINKWKELEAFLSGLSESDNLATILSTKWNQDDTKIANWDTAFS